MLKKILTITLFLSLATPLLCQIEISSEAQKRASELISKMTLDEKIDFIAGDNDGFHINGIARLGIPDILLADGPQGIRNNTQSTMYPCGIALASTWNRKLSLEYGKAIASDARARGIHILLGPGVNMYRAPMCGRNFEYYGEDPFLTSEIAIQYILGVQSSGVMATVKHFCGNNQEWNRHHVSSDIDERTLNEIYFPAFRKAVQVARVGAVMSSYNLLNSVHTSENKEIIKTLRDNWGFQGIYMSDWAATYSTVGAANAGLDLEMPKALYYTRELIGQALANGTISEKKIDEKCQHLLQAFIAFGFLDRKQKDEAIPLDNPASNTVALNVSREAIVLLKNDGILPFSKKTKNLVLMGPNSNNIPTGGGSGFVNPYHTKSIFSSLNESNTRLKINVIPFNGKLDTKQEDFSNEQIRLITKADAIVYCGGFNSEIEHEDGDRPFEIPEAQSKQIRKVAEINPNIVTVINAGGGVRFSDFSSASRAVLMSWYPGQEGGKAIAEILTGETNPSGHLPISIEENIKDNPTFYNYYENVFKNLKSPYSRVSYNEGIFVGYRGYERNRVKPLYPFGFGLSYTEFEFSQIGVKASDKGGFDVSFKVRNIGTRSGATVAQVYVGEVSPRLQRPQKELKGYEKVYLKAGERKEISVHLDTEAFKYYDTSINDFTADPGKFKISVGDSYMNLPLETIVIYSEN